MGRIMTFEPVSTGPRSFAPVSTPRRATDGRQPSETWCCAGEILEPEGDERPRLRAVVSGWVATCRTLADGRRQIFQLLLPGDVCCPGPMGAAPSRYATVALTKARIADFGPLDGILQAQAGDAAALARMYWTEARRNQRAILDHMVRLGGLTGRERTAHLLVDLHARLSRLGLAQGAAMPMPLTQEMLADHLGLSAIHVNRTLQEFSRGRLIFYSRGRVIFTDLGKLADIAGYELAPTSVRDAEARPSRGASAAR